jgi:6-phosphogluconate dehydrogenase
VHAALEAGVPLALIGESVFARCLSGNKQMRLNAEQILSGPAPHKAVDHDALLADLGKALYAAKIISYTQGFGLLQAAAKEYDWQFDYAEIARTWRGGCIIRSAFLDNIAEAFDRNAELANLLFAPYFTAKMKDNQNGLRHVLSAAVMAGVAMPCHASALSYYDGLRNGTSPANLLQAQRDYFGAHMYERTDKPRGEWFHTNWTGAGGKTTSTTYSK